MRPTSPARHGRRGGFTLIEALIALVIVTLTVSLLASAHMQTLRAEASAGRMDGARLQMESVVSGCLLGDDPRQVAGEAGAAGWEARWDIVGGGPETPAWLTWRVAASNEPSPAVVVYMRPGG